MQCHNFTRFTFLAMIQISRTFRYSPASWLLAVHLFHTPVFIFAKILSETVLLCNYTDIRWPDHLHVLLHHSIGYTGTRNLGARLNPKAPTPPQNQYETPACGVDRPTTSKIWKIPTTNVVYQSWPNGPWCWIVIDFCLEGCERFFFAILSYTGRIEVITAVWPVEVTLRTTFPTAFFLNAQCLSVSHMTTWKSDVIPRFTVLARCKFVLPSGPCWWKTPAAGPKMLPRQEIPRRSQRRSSKCSQAAVGHPETESCWSWVVIATTRKLSLGYAHSTGCTVCDLCFKIILILIFWRPKSCGSSWDQSQER